MKTRRWVVIGISILALAFSSEVGFAAGDERGNRGLETQTIRFSDGASVTIVRGAPSSSDSLEKAASSMVPQAEPRVVGGDQLWLVDHQTNQISVCFLKQTIYVGQTYISCLSRY
jgi:hypothetical protein